MMTPPSDIEALGLRLIELREKAFNMSQAQFARLIGVTPQALMNWEQGYNRPNIDMAYKISIATGGVPIGWIYTGDTRGMPTEILIRLQDTPPRKEAKSL